MNNSSINTPFTVENIPPGLDLIGSSGYSNIEFEGDSESDDEATDDSYSEKAEKIKQDSVNPPIPQVRPESKLTMYIQMEFCNQLTLREIIKSGLHKDLDRCWVLFRQILEGLVHIHGWRILHRDLKPENVFIDSAGIPKIGDFGLATTGVSDLKTDPLTPGEQLAQEMTKNVGTALYVAPEVKSNVSGNYRDKVDMYALGIVFFEMCWPLRTGMERSEVLTGLRSENLQLPTEFRSSKFEDQRKIVEVLVTHNPKERPTSAELLNGDLLPVRVEDEWIRAAVAAFRDQKSPHHNQIVSALFSGKGNSEVDHITWHAFSQGGYVWKTQSHIFFFLTTGQLIPFRTSLSDVDYSLIKRLVQEKLTSVFRRHGAKDNSEHRMELFPLYHDYYSPETAVHYLDKSGIMMQLRYDMTLPYAISLARAAQKLDSGKFTKETFAFGNVFRAAVDGGAPRSIVEADFDILSLSDLDLSRKEAEVIKVMDEIIDEFPVLQKTSMCFHLSHSRLLDIILKFCGVPETQWSAAKEVLAKLNIDRCTWQRTRQQLRSAPIEISHTAVEELEKFNFRKNADDAFEELLRIFSGSKLREQLGSVFQDMKNVLGHLETFGTKRPIYVSPLSNFNSKFYQHCIMFQCVIDKHRRHVLAAGGRYDNLIRSQPTQEAIKDRKPVPRAVGMTIAWETIVRAMVDYQKDADNTSLQKTTEQKLPASWTTRLCDVLVASFDSELLRKVGLKTITNLWSHDISAQLAEEGRSPDELVGRRGIDKYSWIVHIRHEAKASERPDLKVKNVHKNEDTEVRSSELISYLRGEIREREQREGANERARLSRISASHTESSHREMTNKVQVLLAEHKGRKVNRDRIGEAAKSHARELINSYFDGPIAAVETRDEILEQVQKVKLSDSDAWKKTIQDVPVSERYQLQELRDILVKFQIQYGAISKKCFIFNFRSGFCMLYDLHL